MPAPGPQPARPAARDLSFDAARSAIAATMQPITDSASVELDLALGRVLAQDLVSPIDVPAHDNAAMDGYAFDGAALQPPARLQLNCIGTVLAGHPWRAGVARGECLRIMTGAPLPAGLDTVVPLEACRSDGAQVTLEASAVHAGAHCRRRGEDLAAGAVALRAGQLLRPADLGLAASLGVTTLKVVRRLRVALFSSGDELAPPGQPLAPGCVHDSNRASLAGALRRLGLDVLDLGQVGDDPAALATTLASAVEQADAVLTSGGVGVGDADHTRALLAAQGEIAFWSVAMRPGRPFGFGTLRDHGGRPVWLFALPGNPVAALVSFYVLAREGLLRLAGAGCQALPSVQARAAGAIAKQPGRTEFPRGTLRQAADGVWEVQVLEQQGSAILSSMSRANALVRLGPAQGPVAAGDLVEVWLFDGLV
jgi:molybdopterin molybdotransferase